MTTVKQWGFKHNRHKNDLIYCLLQPVYIILPIRLLAGGGDMFPGRVRYGWRHMTNG